VKTLLIVRHAQAAPSSGSGGDHARTLTPQGQRDAMLIGKQLRNKRLDVQQIISSDAMRAYMTAEVIARELGQSNADITPSPMLYSATISDWLRVIHDLPDWCDCAALVGHNPSIAELRARLVGPHAISTPPAATAILYFDNDDWRSVEHAIPFDIELLLP
jgi:phosphohistidine phosphatase